MIRIRPIFKGFGIPFLVLALVPFGPAALQAHEFKVTKVYDGDTIRVAYQDIQINVRLAGIDAPEVCEDRKELSQPYSYEATDFLSEEILGEMVDIKGYGHKRYDLMLGVVYLQGKDINLRMIREGWAEVYRGKPPEGLDLEPYLGAEKESMAAAKGMWAQGDHYVSPKEWRKSTKAKSACAIILYGLCDQKGQ